MIIATAQIAMRTIIDNGPKRLRSVFRRLSDRIRRAIADQGSQE